MASPLQQLVLAAIAAFDDVFRCAPTPPTSISLFAVFAARVSIRDGRCQ